MKRIKINIALIIFSGVIVLTNSCKKNKPHDSVTSNDITSVAPSPPPTPLETQLFGDWICDGDTVWATIPYHDNMYLGYHLNLTATPYPYNSNFVTYFVAGLYGPGQTPTTTGTWKEIDGSPTYSHHVLVVFFPATVIMLVTPHALVLAQTDQIGNLKTFYFHK